MQKWEYRIVSIELDGLTVRLEDTGGEGKTYGVGKGTPTMSQFLARYLNELGAEGWELAGVPTADLCIVKRPKG